MSRIGTSDPKDTRDLLKRGGLRRTHLREAVLDMLLGIGRPLTHAEVFGRLEGTINRVTLYRILEALQRAGLAHPVLGSDGAWRYCGHRRGPGGCPGDHPHFQCLECGAMSCLPGQHLPRVDVPPGFGVRSKQLVVYGRCAACGGG